MCCGLVIRSFKHTSHVVTAQVRLRSLLRHVLGTQPKPRSSPQVFEVPQKLEQHSALTLQDSPVLKQPGDLPLGMHE